MNMSDDLVLRERFSAIANVSDDSDWGDVVERAGLSSVVRGSRRRQVRLLVVAGIGVGSVVAALATAPATKPAAVAVELPAGQTITIDVDFGARPGLPCAAILAEPMLIVQ